MRTIAQSALGMLLALGPALAAADDVAPAAPPSSADPRLVSSGEGGRITGGRGAGGGAVTFLANVGSGVIGFGPEYQDVANAHWTLGNLNLSDTLGQGNWKTSLYADAHVGAGDIGPHAFHYTIVDGGILASLGPVLGLQLEERRIDVDTSHGHLPKVGLSLRLTPQLTGSVSYARSYGGNLDTRLKTVRLDYASRAVTWLAGYAWGPAAPAAINFISPVIGPVGRPLKEGFAGLGKSFGRTEWQLVGDYQDLEGTKRYTLTLTCTVHLGAIGRPP